VGDDKYGNFDLNKALLRQGLRRMFLHAWRLQFTHPATAQRIELQAELPAELRAFADHVLAPAPV
jgi:23S rRNA pseudouridine955/2504/2580 synthase